MISPLGAGFFHHVGCNDERRDRERHYGCHLSGPGPASDRRLPAGRRVVGYVSDFEQFMGRYLVEHPEEVEEQRRGWAIWWNRPVDFDELKKAAEDSVSTESYYYGPSLPRTRYGGL